MSRRGAWMPLAALLLAGLLAPSAASASFGFLGGAEGFSLTATNSDESPTTQAGAHPYAFTAHLGLDSSGAELRDLRLVLPPGFLLNPTAASECSAVAFHTPRSSPYEASASGESCPNSTQLGTIAVKTAGTVRHFGLFSLAAPFGSAAAIGAAPFGIPMVFAAKLREADAGLDLSLAGLSQSLDPESLDLVLWGAPWGGEHAPERGNCLNEQTGGSWGTCSVSAPESLIHSYLTLPTTPCGSALSFSAQASSWQGQGAGATASAPALEKCNKSLAIAKVALMSDRAASRTGLAFDLDVNDGGGILNPGGIARPAIKTAVLALPEGLTINPSLGAGLSTCSEAQFAAETAASAEGAGCPNASKVGEVTVEGALGLAEPLQGALYIANPNQNPFHTLLGVYLIARSARRGIAVKSIGEIEPEAHTGRLTATFDELPRLLYRHFALTLREGQRSVLVSPPTCNTYSAELALASWAEPTAFRHEQSAFAIGHGEDGGPCPSGGVEPFHPGLLAGSINPTAGAKTPFYLRMTRGDSEQEITSYSATFPPGLLASISGVTPCPDAAIEAAKQRTGIEEKEHPSCPANSSIGHTLAGYGVGGTLAYAPGSLYLAGPYHGSLLSVAAIDSALVGPFDLGVVVVRSAVRIDAAHAQASIDSAGSDPIPHILAGIPLHLRDIRVYVDRPNFTLNPTSCNPSEVLSRLTGAGSDLFSPADDPSATTSERFQVLGCSALGFKPNLTLRMTGGTKRGRFPSLKATYTPRAGDANLKYASVALPPSVFLAQEHLRTVCTRAQFAAHSCPPSSVYGHATAITPLMETPLQGPVYVRSSSNPVPDLIASLAGGGVSIDLVGRIDRSKGGGIRGTFEALPDAPVSRFTLTLPGGRGSLLVNAEDLCAAKSRATARFAAQSSATEVIHPRLSAKCKKHGKHHRKGR